MRTAAHAPWHHRLRPWLVYVGLSLATLAVYAQVRGFEFVSWDDFSFITENPRATGGLTWDNFVWALKIHPPGQWHPMAWWVHQLNCSLFGVSPGGHHLANLVLHVAAALALLTAFWRLSGDFWPSALVAALFALHPVSAESVAWVSHLRDTLSMLFWGLVMWSYAAYARRRGPLRYLLVLLLFALGLMAKPTLITLPFVLLLLDYWPLKRLRLGPWRAGRDETAGHPPTEPRPESVGRLLLEKVPLFVLSGASAWLSYLSQRAGSSVISLDVLPVSTRLANTAHAYVAHLWHIAWPTKLAPIYPLPESFPPETVAAAVGLLLFLSAAAVYIGRRHGYVLVGWLWFLGTLAPVIGLLKLGAPTSLTDHHAYAPQLGIYAAVAWALFECVRRRPGLRWAALGAVAVILVGSLWLTWRQAGAWRDSETLYRHTLAVTRRNYLAHTNLGKVLKNSGRLEEAIVHYREALRIRPRDPLILYNLGLALDSQGKTPEAMRYYREALRINPNDASTHNNLGLALANQGKTEEALRHYRKALEINPEFALAHYNRGIALEYLGRTDDAIQAYLAALRIQPGMASAHGNVGCLLAEKGRLDEAIGHYRAAIRLSPTHAHAHKNLGIALTAKGLTEEAISHYREALRINPGFVEAATRLAWIRATHPDARFRDGAEAVELAERACALTGNTVTDCLDALAAAYAEAGRFREAAAKARQAAAVAARQDRRGEAALLRQRATLYDQGRPYRDPTLR